jgi:hypothetical protein
MPHTDSEYHTLIYTILYVPGRSLASRAVFSTTVRKPRFRPSEYSFVYGYKYYLKLAITEKPFGISFIISRFLFRKF